MNRHILFFLLTILSFEVVGQTHAFEVNERLGRGINLGNMFEAPSEDAWGNPFQDEYLGMIADLGFDHVRIPIRWEPQDRSLSVAPYTISSTFLERIKHVVDLAHEKKLHAIINMHHHSELHENPDGQKERFLSMWNQISTYFADYSDSLIFEVLNEPHDKMTTSKWNQFASDAVTEIRKTNSTRIIMIGTANAGGLNGLADVELPADDNLILTVHYYNPFPFTHQETNWAIERNKDWHNIKWQNTESERDMVRLELKPLVEFSENHNVPVHIGEFGTYKAVDMESRELWTTFVARYFESVGFSWAYWDFSAGFGIYDLTTSSYRQELVDALLNNQIGDATPINRTELFNTPFNEQGNMQGWVLNLKSDANATSVVQDGKLTIDITNGGTDKAHVQLSLKNILLEEGKNYEIRFRAKSDAKRSISAYTGMTVNPWSAYSGFQSFEIDDSFKEYSFFFQMLQTTDYQARIVFDIGNSDNSFELDYLILNEASFITGISYLKSSDSFFYPNPVEGTIYFSNKSESNILLYSMNGKFIDSKKISNNGSWDLGWLKSGAYLIIKSDNYSACSGKLLKIN